MKHFFILCVILIVSIQIGYSQDQSVYDNYVGTWKWEDKQTDSEFVIILKKSKADWTKFNAGVVDCIIGAYKYKKNGIITSDNLNELIEEKGYIKYPINILGDNSYMRLYVKDYAIKNGKGTPKNMKGSSNVKILEGSDGKIQMQWIVVDDGHQHIYTDEERVFPKGTSLPTNITLTKVE